MRLTCSTDLVYPLQHPENSLGHLQLFLHNCQSFWGLYWRKSLLESTLLEERGRGMIDFSLSSNLLWRESDNHRWAERGGRPLCRVWPLRDVTGLAGSVSHLSLWLSSAQFVFRKHDTAVSLRDELKPQQVSSQENYYSERRGETWHMKDIEIQRTLLRRHLLRLLCKIFSRKSPTMIRKQTVGTQSVAQILMK